MSATAPVLVITNKRAKDWWCESITGARPESLAIPTGVAGNLPLNLEYSELNSAMVQSQSERLWLVTHYEGMTRHWQELSLLHWNTIILDEAHKIRNRKTDRARKLKQIGKTATRRIALTADPLERDITDLWSILNWLDPKTFTSYWKFFYEFLDYTKNYWGRLDPKGIKPNKQQEFGELVSRYMIAHTKEEVLPELPPKIFQTIPITLTGTQLETYRRVAHSSEVQITDDPTDTLFIPNGLARITRLSQVCADPALIGIQAPSAKLEWLNDWLLDNPSIPVAIMSNFREIAQKIVSRHGGALVLGGSTNSDAEIVRFRNGQARLIAGTIQGMGESLNLQRAEVLIFVDCMWSGTFMNQAINRVHRMDIVSSKHIIFLEGEHTIDKLIRKAFESKWEQRVLVQNLIDRYEEFIP